MPDETETSITETIKTASDGSVKISVEKYNDLLETIADQKGSLSKLRDSLNQARNEPPVIHRTVVEKTVEMLAKEHRAWGTTFMGLGASMFVVGAFRFRAGRTGS